MKKQLNHWSFYWLILWALISVLAPLLASKNGNSLIPYNANQIDYKNYESIGPFSTQNIENLHHRHWLGTDELGRDVLAQLIHGSKTAFLIGIGSMVIAALIGIFLGGMSAYFGDKKIRINRLRVIFSLIVNVILIVYVTSILQWKHYNNYQLFIHSIISLTIIILVNYIISKISFNKISSSKMYLPIDLVIGRIIELFDSIPLIFLLLTLSTLFNPSVGSVILSIGLVAWPSIAKFSRAEFMKVNQLNFIESAKALGFKNWRIVFKHVLPSAISPVLITLFFGLASAILLEATLSFIGVGLSSETASWGKLLASARNNYEAWWLAIFPGLMIFMTLFSLNTLAKRLQSSNQDILP